HNLADKHKTHLAVGLHVIKAIRRLPKELRPQKLYGCEVWRSLDFLPDEYKVLLDVSARPELQSALINAYRSQIVGGKNYEQAVIGRLLANATFQDAYAPDAHSRLSIAMDMTPLILDDHLCPRAFMRDILRATSNEIDANLAGFLGRFAFLR
nr:PIG-L family deacetylase [Anaerolineaceae bacterium]